MDDDDPNKEDIIKAKERAILTLGETLSKYGFAEGNSVNIDQKLAQLDVSILLVLWLLLYTFKCAELGELIQTSRGIIDVFSKAKAAKIIRELVDRFLDMNKTIGNEVLYLYVWRPFPCARVSACDLSGGGWGREGGWSLL